MEHWVCPSRFSDADTLFMYESLQEMIAAIVGGEHGDVDADMLALCASTQCRLDEIDTRVLIPSIFLLR